MESLQLAQVLADLSSLNATEPHAAAALVNANKTIDQAIEKASQQPAASRPDAKRNRTTSSTAPSTRTASPAAKVDKYGRRLLISPPLSRSNSATGSAPGTPRHHSDAEDDFDRASTLMALHEIRAKLRQQDNTSLMKAREKINALAARQMARSPDEKSTTEAVRQPRYPYPKT